MIFHVDNSFYNHLIIDKILGCIFKFFNFYKNVNNGMPINDKIKWLFNQVTKDVIYRNEIYFS
jgi:hypothetical protein